MNRIIFHIDVNSAFLSWTAVKRLKDDPSAVDLRTIPSVVGGDIKTRHGIVTAKSIPAKKYGINTAEPISSALQKCPKLVIVSSDPLVLIHSNCSTIYPASLCSSDFSAGGG